MSNSYTPTEWIPNRTIATADVFNNMEEGILNAHQKADDICVNVKNFGAKGDGVSDDTVAIRSAINSIAGKYDCNNEDTSHYGGGTVFLPSGTYLITDTIFIPSNITIKGTGKTTFGINKDNIHCSTILYNGVNNKPAISFIGINKTTNDRDYIYARSGREIDNRTNIPTYSAVLKDLSIYANSNQDLGIAFGGCPTSRIDNVKVSGFKVGIITSSCWGSTIEKLFSFCSFIGVLVHQSCNLLNFKDLYVHINGNTKNVESSSKLYEYVNSEETVLNNSQCAIHINNSRGLSFDNVTIEKFKNGCNIGSSTISSTSTNWSNLWIEGVEKPIVLKNGRHIFTNANYISSDSNIEYFSDIYNTNVVFINSRGGFNNLLNDCDNENKSKFVSIASQYTTGNYNFVCNDLSLGLTTLTDNIIPDKSGQILIGNSSKQIKSLNSQRVYVKDGNYNTGWDILGGNGYSSIAPYVNGSVNWSKDFRFDNTKGYVFGDNIFPKTSNNFDLGNNLNCFRNGYFNGVIKTGLGITENRPILEKNDQGALWFDSKLNKPIWWTGTKWVDALGITV